MDRARARGSTLLAVDPGPSVAPEFAQVIFSRAEPVWKIVRGRHLKIPAAGGCDSSTCALLPK